MRTTVLVLGGSGMLGSMVVDTLARNPDLAVTATARTAALAESCAGRVDVAWRVFDGDAPDLDAALALVDGQRWVINAIGITKPLIRDDNAFEIERAIRINGHLPHALARRAGAAGARVLQIATDCVFSGARGRYTETDPHDALDVYGKTKSLGEVWAPHVHHLRCSIIGPEPRDHKFLLDWFLGQPRGAELNGFVNHDWNGVTTLHFAKLCEAVVMQDLALPHLHHVVPTGSVTKADMLELFAAAFGRQDVAVRRVTAGTTLDRTLATSQADLNRRLWDGAGYHEPPTVPRMLDELSRHPCRLREIQAPAAQR